MKIICLILFGSLVILFFNPVSNLASADTIKITNPLNVTTVQDVIAAISNFAWQIALAIAPVMFVIAGFLYITSAGDPKKVDTAKKFFIYTIVGLVIVLLATSFYYVLKSLLGG